MGAVLSLCTETHCCPLTHEHVQLQNVIVHVVCDPLGVTISGKQWQMLSTVGYWSHFKQHHQNKAADFLIMIKGILSFPICPTLGL